MLCNNIFGASLESNRNSKTQEEIESENENGFTILKWGGVDINVRDEKHPPDMNEIVKNLTSGRKKKYIYGIFAWMEE